MYLYFALTSLRSHMEYIPFFFRIRSAYSSARFFSYSFHFGQYVWQYASRFGQCLSHGFGTIIFILLSRTTVRSSNGLSHHRGQPRWLGGIGRGGVKTFTERNCLWIANSCFYIIYYNDYLPLHVRSFPTARCLSISQFVNVGRPTIGRGGWNRTINHEVKVRCLAVWLHLYMRVAGNFPNFKSTCTHPLATVYR